MCAKLSAQTAAEEMFEIPLKTPESATMTIPSPRKLPSPPSAQRYICGVCRSESTVDSISPGYVSLFMFNDFLLKLT